MGSVQEVKLEELGAHLPRYSYGLILGPVATIGPAYLRELASGLRSLSDLQTDSSDLIAVNAHLIKNGISEAKIREVIANATLQIPGNKDLKLLARIGWKAVVSTAFDLNFEQQMIAKSEASPLSPSVAVITDLGTVPPPRTIPIFKFLGAVDRGDLAVFRSAVLAKQTTWKYALKAFADSIKGAPVFCLGMSDQKAALEDVLVRIFESNSTRPGGLIFLASDPLMQDNDFTHFLQTHINVIVVSATIADLVTETARISAKSAVQVPLRFEKDSLSETIAPFRDIVLLVNDHLKTNLNVQDGVILQDLLFSPTILRWDPFVHGFDLQRTVGKQLEATALSILNSPQEKSQALVLVGPAACGKTTILKRLAYNLAAAEYDVFWFQPTRWPDTQQVVQRLFESLANSKHRPKRFIAVIDDPPTLGSTQVREIVSAANAVGIQLFLIVASRTSDWLVRDHIDITGNVDLVKGAYVEIAQQFDESELQDLQSLLQLWRIAKDPTDAELKIRTLRAGNSGDILSAMFLLVPGTKAPITDAVRNEFFRLGDTGILSNVIIGSVTKDTSILRDAYELIAVADHYKTPLPIEVLVSALNVEYSDWLDTAKGDGPAWGIFYDEIWDDGETICYRPRNSVVTRIIVQTINGGFTGHSGEVRTLLRLLTACTGGQSVYREFCLRALIPARKLEDKRLEPDEGVRLFDAALAALPYRDRTLLHHKALWVSDHVKEPLKAVEIMTEALSTKPYPYADKEDIDENIHNSIAASTLQAIDRGQLSLDDGKRIAFEHLEKGRHSAAGINLHGVHIYSNLMLRLVQQLTASQRVDRFVLANKALNNIDRAMQIHGNMSGGLESTRSSEMLGDVRNRIIEHISTYGDLAAAANEVWTKNRSQSGFVLAARKGFSDALKAGQGRKFNEVYQYIVAAMDRVKAAKNVGISPELYEIGVQLYYEWRIVGEPRKGAAEPIDWSLIRTWALGALAGGDSEKDPLLLYICGLSEAHLNRWTDSGIYFDTLRKSSLPKNILYRRREFLLNAQGDKRRVQGVVHEVRLRGVFLSVTELGRDFHTEQRDSWGNENEIAHAHVRFSFAGPTATKIIS